mmetsp:Transcript_53645/g.96418  ORF Transcript_53645/g.96418 Transcript_53645/m.96418 type:complete len:201 (-) Transcript_53645:1601-2203(-)
MSVRRSCSCFFASPSSAFRLSSSILTDLRVSWEPFSSAFRASRSLRSAPASDFAAPSCCLTVSPRVRACEACESTACLAVTMRRTAASSAARAARDKGCPGIRSMSVPNSLTTRFPTELAAPSSSSQDCQSLICPCSCWSASRPFCCRTKASSRAIDSFSSCQYSFRTDSSPTARSCHSDFMSCFCCLNTMRSDSSLIGS